MKRLVTQLLIVLMLTPSLACGMALCPKNDTQPATSIHEQPGKDQRSHCSDAGAKPADVGAVAPSAGMLLADCSEVDQALASAKLKEHIGDGAGIDLAVANISAFIPVSLQRVDQPIRGSPPPRPATLAIYLATNRLRI